MIFWASPFVRILGTNLVGDKQLEDMFFVILTSPLVRGRPGITDFFAHFIFVLDTFAPNLHWLDLTNTHFVKTLAHELRPSTGALSAGSLKRLLTFSFFLAHLDDELVNTAVLSVSSLNIFSLTPCIEQMKLSVSVGKFLNCRFTFYFMFTLDSATVYQK